MPLTTSGRLVRPGGTEHPSLSDIAISLSRQPRFAGHCKRWWSVLDHTLFCDEIVKAQEVLNANRTHVRLALLLHDAHEAVTADVPTDFKNAGLKVNQADLDFSLTSAFFPGGPNGYHWQTGLIKHYDRRALCAEARIVGPPARSERILELFGVCEETNEDIALLCKLLEDNGDMRHRPILGRPPLQWDQESHPAVKEYLRRMIDLL